MEPVALHESVSEAGVTLGVLLTIATLLTLLWVWVGRPVYREWKDNRDFQQTFREDWLGTPERPGVPPRPGVMSRLADMGSDWTTLAIKVRKVERDLLKVRSEVTWLLTHRCPAAHTETSGEFTMKFDTPPEDEEG